MPAGLPQHIRFVGVIVLALATLGVPAHAGADARNKSAPTHVTYEIPSLQSWIEIAAPVYRADTVEETPYQLLRICNRRRGCHTVIDSQGMDGFTVSADPSLAFSPDRLYLIVLRMTNLDPKNKTFGKQYYEIYGLREGHVVGFRAQNGENAKTDNIGGWSPHDPHALEITLASLTPALAYPIGER